MNNFKFKINGQMSLVIKSYAREAIIISLIQNFEALSTLYGSIMQAYLSIGAFTVDLR